jgi:hypothetical protein
MEQQVRRYVLGAAGAGFVLIWTTLGMTTAILALVAAFAATHSQRLIETARYRRQRPLPSRQRQTMRARPLREEGDDELPLVPDEPSLIISANGF